MTIGYNTLVGGTNILQAQSGTVPRRCKCQCNSSCLCSTSTTRLATLPSSLSGPAGGRHSGRFFDDADGSSAQNMTTSAPSDAEGVALRSYRTSMDPTVWPCFDDLSSGWENGSSGSGTTGDAFTSTPWQRIAAQSGLGDIPRRFSLDNALDALTASVHDRLQSSGLRHKRTTRSSLDMLLDEAEASPEVDVSWSCATKAIC